MFNFVANRGNGVIWMPDLGEWIYRDLRHQHGIESVVIGTLSFCAVGSVLLLTYLLRAGFEVNLKERMRCFMGLYIPTIVPLAAFLGSWCAILHIFTLKFPQYNYGNVGVIG